MRESDYYPEGVSGNEWQIAGGPIFDQDIESSCSNEACPAHAETKIRTVEFEGHGSTAYGIWECDLCGTENNEELEAPEI